MIVNDLIVGNTWAWLGYLGLNRENFYFGKVAWRFSIFRIQCCNSTHHKEIVNLVKREEWCQYWNLIDWNSADVCASGNSVVWESSQHLEIVIQCVNCRHIVPVNGWFLKLQPVWNASVKISCFKVKFAGSVKIRVFDWMFQIIINNYLIKLSCQLIEHRIYFRWVFKSLNSDIACISW